LGFLAQPSPGIFIEFLVVEFGHVFIFFLPSFYMVPVGIPSTSGPLGMPAGLDSLL